MTQERPFSEVIGDIYAEYEANASLYDPVRGIHVPPFDGQAYTVSASPLTGQPGTAIRVSMGGHGDGDPIYTVKPNEIVFNPGRELSRGSGLYVYTADDDEFRTDPDTAEQLLRLIRGAHRYAQHFKRQ